MLDIYMYLYVINNHRKMKTFNYYYYYYIIIVEGRVCKKNKFTMLGAG